MNNRGQFSIIAALLVAIVLIGTLIAVYAMIRYDSSQSQSPQSLTATDETNLAILKALGFTVGYYGSMLQVTGNQTYAETNATAYMNSALQYIESMNPSWGESISMTSLNLKTDWFTNPSISEGQISVVYDLTNMGIYGINYTTSCSLGVQIFKSPYSNQVCLGVTQDSTEPVTSLGRQNFAFYDYNYSTSNWQLENPSLTPVIFTNGTYLINTPPGIDNSAFMVQVTDSRGIMVEASSYNSYNLDFTFGSQSMTQNSPIIVQLLQNGTLQTFGQDLLNTTQALPIPPIPVKSLNLCQTGSTTDIPFQVEDWASNYQIPLGLTSNYTIFSNSQMIVFEVSPSTSQLTLWWNGADTAIQPSSAYTDKYFTADNPGAGTLSNGIITLNVNYNGGVFEIQTVAGTVTSTANFMRLNKDASTYGSGPAYIIQYGVVRDIVQEEAEWSGGVTNCPNVYSQIVITLPANVNYFTYQLRLIFINSTVARNISDISPLQLTTTSISKVQAMTENGITEGIPNVSTSNGYFNNSTGSAHHWSQLVNANNNLQGTGIMFTSTENQQLYAFDSMTNPHAYTGALYVNTATPVIELDPVTSAGSVSFTSPKDITWYGAVATFNGANPIYASSGNSGLWSLVEQPPTVTITPVSSSATSITLSPSSGNVGTSVTVSGGWFLYSSQITITFNGITVKTVTATPNGAIPSGTTFTVPSSTFGSYTVTATDTDSNSASANFILIPLDHFTVTASGGGSIGTQTAGVPFSITITAEDSSGNTVTGYNGTNTLTVSSGTITPTSTGAFTAGVWTGSVTLTTSGSGITIGTTGSSKSGTSNTFTVNAGAATYFVVSGFPSPTTAGVANGVTVTAYDAYGNIATGYAGTVTITSSDGKAVLPSPGTLTNGVGSFSVTLETAGSQSISASATGVTSGSQTGITVTAASLAGFTISGYPSSVTAGANFGSNNVVVTAVDAYGNTVTSYTGSVYFTSTDTLAVLPYTSSSKYTFTTGTEKDNGVHTFAGTGFTLKTVGSGTQTITVTDGTHSATSSAIAVTPGALYKFSFSAISTQTAGTAFSVTITAQDQYGNTVTSYTGTNTLSDLSSTISPTTTGTFSSGVWTGSVTITKAYTSDTISTTGSSKSGTSGSFNVNSGALYQFVFSTISTQTAGTAFSVTITAQDQYGNTVTSYGSSTALTETGGGAGGTVSPASVTFTSGVYTGNVYVTKSGSGVTITATHGSVSTASSTFTVNPGALTQFVFSTIATQTSGKAFSVTITAEDQYGNTANLNQAETLDLHNVSGTGTLTLSPTSVTFTNGVATPSVTITCTGTHTVYLYINSYQNADNSNTFTV